MKALIIAPQPFFSPRGTPFSVYYRTMISRELGIEADFLTYGEGQEVDIPNVNFIRTPRFKFLGNVKIGPSLLKLFLDFFIIFKMIVLLIKNKYDFVHAHEESVFFALFLKPIFRFKLIYDMHSSLPQQLNNFNFSKSKILYYIFKKLEDSCLKQAQAVITICPDLRDYVNSIISDKRKHYLIENSIFEDVKLKNLKKNEPEFNINDFVNPSLIEGKKLIVYAGTLEKYQGIDILIKSFAIIENKLENCFLLIVGGSKEQVDKFNELSESLNIKNICLTGRVPQKVAKLFNSKADILVSPRSTGTNTPLKVYEQLASGIPIVATNIYSHTQVLNKNVCFLAEPEPNDFANVMFESLTNVEVAKQTVDNALKLYKENFSREIYKSKLKKVLELVA